MKLTDPLKVLPAHYVDVHTHLTHHKFDLDRHQVIEHASRQGLGKIIVNGLNPPSNRMTLALAQKYEIIEAALGIYPLDAINHMVGLLPYAVETFDVDQEIAFIEQQAQAGNIIAIGECGLDGHWVGDETFEAQERVFGELIAVAQRNQLPLIIHTRKREVRCQEILAAAGIKKVNFHCFGGRSKHAIRWAEEYGWHFSIPANCGKNEAFQKLLRSLPEELILTETDAPYLGPERGQRNDPSQVTHTVALLAKLRSWTLEQAQERIWQNYQGLFTR